ncbi:hypothetical protein, partial [Hydrogenophaga sp.]|uniref:hypothetical protein n=1 Tax=Hydrogenophaga sp. TaxID=1904254 RepID=UPI001698E3CC
TVEQVQGFLDEHKSSENGGTGHLEAELGPFAAGRIDVDKLATLFSSEVSLDTLTVETIAKARDTMAELTERNSDLFLVDVKPGGCLHDAVEKALEEIGRAFGAVRIFELTRSGSLQGNEHARSLGAFPFDRWSRGERRLAPPLVVTVDGADLAAAGLAEFLDGSQKIVLVVRGPCAPAPLVRLITPGVFVTQTADPSEIERMAAYDGPGIAALVPESAARFVHDPSAGAEAWQRVSLSHVPEKEPKQSVGGLSGFQQAQEVRQLVALAKQPPAAAAVAGEA